MLSYVKLERNYVRALVNQSRNLESIAKSFLNTHHKLIMAIGFDQIYMSMKMHQIYFLRSRNRRRHSASPSSGLYQVYFLRSRNLVLGHVGGGGGLYQVYFLRSRNPNLEHHKGEKDYIRSTFLGVGIHDLVLPFEQLIISGLLS